MAAVVPEEAAATRAGMFRSLRNYNYRLFAAGGVISNVGSWMQRTAQDWLVLSLTGGSGTALGITVALQFLPMVLFGLWGGMLADRYPKRRLLVVADSLMGLLALVLGLLTVTGTVQVWHVYLMAFLLGVIACVEVPTRQSFVVEMVGHDDLSNAIALNSSTFNLARVVGPALAGLAINWIGTGPIFIVNAVSFGAVITGLFLMRAAELHPAERVARAKGQLREGLRYVAKRPDLLLPILVVAFAAIFTQSVATAVALMATKVFDAGSSAFGLGSSALALGAVTGALLAARRVQLSRRFLLLGAVLFGVFQVLAGLAPGFVFFLLLLIPAGMALITVNTTANATVQHGSSPEMRGRVMGIYILVFTAGTPVGAPLVGWLSELAGPRVALVVIGLTSIVGVGLALLLTRLVAIRQGVAPPRPAQAARRALQTAVGGLSIRRWRPRGGDAAESGG
nr:MFS transporter [Acrocarpospora catenulata]